MTGQLKAVRMGVKMGAKSEARWGGRKVYYHGTAQTTEGVHNTEK